MDEPRELELMEASIEHRLASAKDLVDTQFVRVIDDMSRIEKMHDLDVASIRSDLTRAEDIHDQRTFALRDDIKGKIKAIHLQLTLMEKHRLEQKQDAGAALQAALLSAKAAVDKSEISVTEQLKQITATFSAAIAGIESTIGDVKDRIGRMESVREGSRESSNTTIAWFGVALTFIIIIVNVGANMLIHHV